MNILALLFEYELMKEDSAFLMKFSYACYTLTTKITNDCHRAEIAQNIQPETEKTVEPDKPTHKM